MPKDFLSLADWSAEDQLAMLAALGIAVAYVVVRTGDLRRLVVPLRHFLDKPFQSWSLSGTKLLAEATVDADYSTPLVKLREEVGAIVASSELWDREFWNLQVTDAGGRSIRLRILATADSAKAVVLGCEIREKVIVHLQEKYPWALPRIRSTVESGTLPSDAS